MIRQGSLKDVKAFEEGGLERLKGRYCRIFHVLCKDPVIAPFASMLLCLEG